MPLISTRLIQCSAFLRKSNNQSRSLCARLNFSRAFLPFSLHYLSISHHFYHNAPKNVIVIQKGGIIIEQLSTYLSSCLQRKGWIRTEDIPHFKYWLDVFWGKVIFFLFLFVVCEIFRCFTEAISFSFPLLAFRRRMGGWHASSRLFCQIVSIDSVIFVCCFLGPTLTNLALWINVFINCVIIGIAFFLPPAYPSQLHFSNEEAKGNLQKKNLFLVMLIIIQGLLFAFNLNILIYTSLGLCFGIASVLIEHTTKKLRKDNKNNAKIG